jgi:hypothetical protein
MGVNGISFDTAYEAGTGFNRIAINVVTTSFARNVRITVHFVCPLTARACYGQRYVITLHQGSAMTKPQIAEDSDPPVNRETIVRKASGLIVFGTDFRSKRRERVYDADKVWSGEHTIRDYTEI